MINNKDNVNEVVQINYQPANKRMRSSTEPAGYI